MQSVLYDGSWSGFLCAVFDVYEYKFEPVTICAESCYVGHLFGQVHRARMNDAHSERVWKGLERILSSEACDAIYRTFLSEQERVEDYLLAYIRYAFASGGAMESDFANDAVLFVTQMAKRVWREKHRMEAFVRFQKTADGLFCAFIEPDFNVLPIIAPHFKARYSDQRWLIYDIKRKYAIYYDGNEVEQVTLNFAEATGPANIAHTYDQSEDAFQALWQQYFKSVNIAARKNSKLHVQHMPRRYWKYLTEKKPAT